MSLCHLTEDNKLSHNETLQPVKGKENHKSEIFFSNEAHHQDRIPWPSLMCYKTEIQRQVNIHFLPPLNTFSHLWKEENSSNVECLKGSRENSRSSVRTKPTNTFWGPWDLWSDAWEEHVLICGRLQLVLITLKVFTTLREGYVCECTGSIFSSAAVSMSSRYKANQGIMKPSQSLGVTLWWMSALITHASVNYLPEIQRSTGFSLRSG